MVKLLWNQVGARAAHAVVGGQLQGSRLNMKLGIALLRDRRIGMWHKLIALAVGGAVTALLVALEIAPEGILAVLLPGLGLALDFVADGLEALMLPILLGALVLPFVATRSLVDQIMAERAGAPSQVATPELRS